MNNLHISLTEFRNESRVLKEINSILKYSVINMLKNNSCSYFIFNISN
ncbi:hypothetical protein PT447_05525 [Aliarcobacter butzleri]|nr:hypothetical protein [Aliarcobacter butzleri]MDK2064383.1 hypothetical protein [Aliarcobacter butzleri]